MIELQPRIVRHRFAGGLTLFALIAIAPGLASAQSLTSAVVHPATVVNGTPSVGTVTLSTAAPAGGASVLLSSSSPAAVTHPAVLVPQGATSATFVVDTVAVTVSTTVRIDATYNGVTFSPTLTVTPRVPVRGASGDLWADVVIGHPDFSQTTMHEVTAARLFSPGGILVDRSVRPNRVYLFDGGNNRVLGFSHLGACAGGLNVGLNCTADSDCPGSTCAIQEGRGADLVLGQPSFTSSACNGDNGFQRYPARAPASASTLCSTPEIQVNMEERGGWANLALDSAGNLYVPDFDNHRVLRYNSPFTNNTAADYVWGQGNFTDNTCNRGRTGPAPEGGPPTGDAESLCLRSFLNKGFTAGVDIDSSGNLWVTDNSNHRVLRFTKDPVTGIPKPVADLVLGQPTFATSQSGAGLNQMCAPAAVRVDGDGTVYVADSNVNCGEGFDGRVLVFSPPLSNGMFASGTLGSGLRHPSGLTLDPAGGIWVTDTENSQFLLFNGGSVQKVLGKGCPDYTGRCAGDPADGPLFCYADGRCVESSLVCEAKGSIGIDSDGNVFLAANTVHDMWRFPAPIPSLSTTCPTPATPTAHSADNRIFRPSQYGIPNHVGAHGFMQASGLAVTTDQLIVAEQRRLLFWNGPSTLTSGRAADGYVEQGQFTGFDLEGTEFYGRITVDRALPTPHLWTLGFPNFGNGAQVEVFDLPLQTGAAPIPGKTLTSPLNVKGGGTIDWDVLLAIGGIAAASDGSKIWIADPVRHRVFRVSDALTSPIVDIVLGQAGLDPVLDTRCNRGNSLPSQTGLCRPGAVTLDPLGNVYVSDGSLETDGNLRLLEFDASVFPVNPPVALFGLPASRVFGRGGDFTEPIGYRLFSSLYNKYIAQAPTQPAFTSDGQMVVGTLGDLNFPVIFKTPLLRDQVDGYLNDFMAYGGYSAVFDSNDDLYMLDLDHASVFIYRHPLCSPLPTATVSGGGSICGGGSATIQAALTGTAPWTVKWSDGVTQSGVATSPATRSVSPAFSTMYTIADVSDASCAGTASGSAMVVVDPTQAPTITSFTPTGGPAGTSVTINGTSFTGATAVKFNGTAAVSFSVDFDTRITATSPPGATTGAISVTTGCGTGASAASFTVGPAPTITSFTPAGGAVGASMTINGTGFTGATQVLFNGTPASFTVMTPIKITATVPAGATTGKISVTAPTGNVTSAGSFTVASGIISFSPNFGAPGASVQITGSNFTGTTAVKFNGLSAAFIIDSNTQVTATVPANATTGPISVTNAGGTSTSATSFTVAPRITSFSPTSGPAGASVTINGANFTAATAVRFNGTSATIVTVNTAIKITATVPTGATTGTISVTTLAGTTTSATSFTVHLLPTITSFSPVNGAVGALVTINGTNYTGISSVKLNGTAAAYTVNSAIKITATVPTGATTGRITVTNPAGMATSTTDFTVAPRITSFTPTSGIVGTSVVINGANFTGATSVKFNGTPAASYTVNSAIKITATVPSEAATGKISVTTPVGTATSTANFGVTPKITGFSPASGGVSTNVVISGSGFNGVSSVKFNGLAASFTRNSSTQITAPVPANATTGKITVTTAGGTATSATDFVVAPRITTFSPTSGPPGTVVVINGVNFTGATLVKFNGVAATFLVNSATKITATVPAGTATGKITVATSAGTATSATNFTVM